MAIVAALVAPRIGFDRGDDRRALQKWLAIVALARDEAAIAGVRWRLLLWPDRWRIEWLDPSADPPRWRLAELPKAQGEWPRPWRLVATSAPPPERWQPQDKALAAMPPPIGVLEGAPAGLRSSARLDFAAHDRRVQARIAPGPYGIALEAP